MDIIYKSNTTFKFGTEKDFRDLPKLRYDLKWHMGIDGSSTSYGLALYTFDYSQVHLFTFCRGATENAGTFREVMYDWLRTYLHGIQMETVTYERTPEGYKPPSSHAEKVMRETEAAVKNFVFDRNYLMTKGKDYIFDIFPNSWKSFSVPKDRSNLGKVDKELNAEAVVRSCGLDVEEWVRPFDSVPYAHDYDALEALGVGRYGSHFVLKDDGTVRMYKDFSRVGTRIVIAKRIYKERQLGEELKFVGEFGSGKTPRICSLNENQSVPQNFMALDDREFNNILIVNKDSPETIYIDLAFGFNLEDQRDYIILSTRTSKTDAGVDRCKQNGYSAIYI